jgi:aryl-alcohol dehydrogenase-like predicted oxidoreductase
MKTRILGNTGFAVSEVGLGCWQFGGDFGPINEATVDGIIDAAQETGTARASHFSRRRRRRSTMTR